MCTWNQTIPTSKYLNLKIKIKNEYNKNLVEDWGGRNKAQNKQKRQKKTSGWLYS